MKKDTEKETTVPKQQRPSVIPFIPRGPQGPPLLIKQKGVPTKYPSLSAGAPKGPPTRAPEGPTVPSSRGVLGFFLGGGFPSDGGPLTGGTRTLGGPVSGGPRRAPPLGAPDSTGPPTLFRYKGQEMHLWPPLQVCLCLEGTAEGGLFSTGGPRPRLVPLGGPCRGPPGRHPVWTDDLLGPHGEAIPLCTLHLCLLGAPCLCFCFCLCVFVRILHWQGDGRGAPRKEGAPVPLVPLGALGT